MHSIVRLRGHGLTVVPFAPGRVVRDVEGTGSLDVTHESGDRTCFARLLPDGQGGYRSRTAAGTASTFDVLDVATGPLQLGWQIETRVFTCDWPRGFALVMMDPSVVFDLAGESDVLITLQRPAVARLAAGPGQHIVRQDAMSMQLAYEIGRQPWVQRHRVVTVGPQPVVVTVQAPTTVATAALTIADELATSIAPWTD